MYKFILRVILQVLSLLILCYSPLSFARWATIEDASVEFDHYKREIKVNADGTSEELIEMRVNLLKESGRESYSNYPLYYNEDDSKLEVIDAKTLVGQAEYPVDKQQLEDKPLASSPHGFDQHRQILIAFPNTEVGAGLYLKYKLTYTKPLMKNYYETQLWYGAGEYFKNSYFFLESKLPFYFAVNDPKQNLQIKHNKNSDRYTLEITQNKPIYTAVIDEDYPMVNPKVHTIVHVSTINDWKSFATQLTGKYHNVLNQSLPNMFKSIAQQAELFTQPIDQINFVTSQIMEKVHYMGDWRTVAGRYEPHDLAHIAKVQLGDCKDFSISTAAILNNLGYQAHVALVNRGENIYDDVTDLPGFKFNHAIVHAVDPKTKKNYWLDPTNIVSMASGIFPDISGRRALILDINQPKFANIPEIDPLHSQVNIQQSWDLNEPYVTAGTGEISLKGERAIVLTAAQLFSSDDSIKNRIMQIVSDQYRTFETKCELPDLTSRNVKDLTIPYQFKERTIETRTNAGISISLPLYFNLSSFINIKPDQVSDNFVGGPNSRVVSTIIKNIKLIDTQPLGMHIESPWIKADRVVSYKKLKNNRYEVILTDKIITLKKRIENSELHSKSYQQMKLDLEAGFSNAALVFARN